MKSRLLYGVISNGHKRFRSALVCGRTPRLDVPPRWTWTKAQGSRTLPEKDEPALVRLCLDIRLHQRCCSRRALLILRTGSRS